VLKDRRLKSVDLADQALAAANALGPVLNAFAFLDQGGALAQARERDRELEAGIYRGPLHGIPITVKDIIDVGGLPTGAACDSFDRLPSDDAVSVARLRAAGAVILGKVTTHQFALGVTSPQSRNPHDRGRLPGGSSGGSAIAVATGMGFASLGTDTRASIRVPAALSGVVGFKPTFGGIPVEGLVFLSWSIDNIAPMARSVEDAALMMDVLMGLEQSLAAVAGADVTGLKVGIPPAALSGAGPEVIRAFEAATEAMRAGGISLCEVTRPSDQDFDNSNAAGLIISRCEAAAAHRSMNVDPAAYWQEVREQIEEGEATSAIDYLDAQRLRAELSEGMLAVFDGLDVLAMPTALCTAPPAEDFADYLYLLSRNAIPWSLVGFPAISVPCGFSPEGLPIGIQFVARPGEEATLVALGSAFEERLLPLWDQRNAVLTY
jgi:aspartyl-tRNA(Asn)/glutamyl-tRNA(Gln) amidotransferase subunit A